MRISRALLAGHGLKDLKYRMLGLDPHPKTISYGPAPWSESDTLQYLRQTRLLAQSIIQDLADMSDLAQTAVALPQIRSQMSQPSPIEDAQLRRLLKKSTQSLALPLIPKLAAFDYGPAATEKINHCFYALLNPQNGKILDRNLLNTLMGYFLKVNDWRTAYHALRLLIENGAGPDRITLHLLLQSQAERVRFNPYPTGMYGHPLILTQRCLRVIGSHGVRADSTTWNYILQCMPFGFGKSFIVEEMDRRGIPLNSASRGAILQTVIDDRKKSSTPPPATSASASASAASIDQNTSLSTQLLECLDPNDLEVVRLLIDYILSSKSPENLNVNRALSHLDSAELSAEDRASPLLLNTFLRHFAARRHLDWQFGILSLFSTTQWNEVTWQYFIEGASFLNDEEPEKFVVLGTIIRQALRENVPFTSRARYLARRAVRKYNAKLRDLGDSGFKQLVAGLKWQKPMQPVNPGVLKTLKSDPINLEETQFAKIPRTDCTERRASLVEFLECT